MASTVSVYLLGGPCNGTTKVLTEKEYESGQTTCRGATYKSDPADETIQRPHVFRFAPAQTGGGGSVTAPRLHRGWNDLRASFNHRMPAALKSSRSSTDAALRTLAKARKVRL